MMTLHTLGGKTMMKKARERVDESSLREGWQAPLLLVPVSLERGHATLPLPTLARVLPLSADLGEEWVIVHLAREPFRFLLDAPVLIHQARVIPLVGGA